MTLVFLIIGGTVIFVAAIIIIIVVYEKKRTQALQAVAQAFNLAFTNKDEDHMLDSLRAYHLFSQGHSQKIKNVMKGTAGDIDISIFDFQYTISSGKSSSIINQTVMLFRTPLLQLPDFALRPENVFHRIGSAFGYQDINFDSSPTFSKKYLLRGNEEEAIRQAFTPDRLAWYEQHPGLCTEGYKDTLMFYRAHKRVKPADYRAFIELGQEVYNLFKSGK